MRPSSGIKIGRILGIDIVINVSWILIFLLVAISFADLFSVTRVDKQDFPGGIWPWLVGFAAALVFFACLLIHELSHSYVATRNGVEISRITLFIFGGVAEMSEDVRAPGVEFKMAIAGPLVTFVLAGIFYGLYRLSSGLETSPVLIVPLFYLAFLNLAIGVFNLLPGFPLDGGRVLRAILWKATGDLRKATRIASVMGQGIGILIAGAGLVFVAMRNFIGGIWFLLIGFFIYKLAQSGYRQTLLRLASKDTRAADIMYTDFPTIDVSTSLTTLRSSYFSIYRLPAFPVTRQGEVVGIVTREDLDSVDLSEWDILDTGRIMRPVEGDRVVSPDTPLEKVFKRLLSRDTYILVMEGDEVRGMLTREELMRYLEARVNRMKAG